jgi:hypothetical protein
VVGHRVLAPSTLGTFLRAFTFSHIRQLDRVLGELIGRAWAAGAGPGKGRLGAWVSNRVGCAVIRGIAAVPSGAFTTIPAAREREDRMATAVAQERLVEVGADESGVSDRRPVGEEKTFRAYDPDQVLLMAPVLAEWVPEGDLAHFVSDLVESGTLDLSAIYASYEEERGYPPYDPRLCECGVIP